jgi:gamma-glutamylcyclotransferase (GGCT)/AIG2-like uncharacterized protein YtfP
MIISSPDSRAAGLRVTSMEGWYPRAGVPASASALVLEPEGPAIYVRVFESVDLPAHWSRLDDFEGPEYQRVVTTVHMSAGEVEASIYVLGVQDQGGGSLS